MVMNERGGGGGGGVGSAMCPRVGLSLISLLCEMGKGIFSYRYSLVI